MFCQKYLTVLEIGRDREEERDAAYRILNEASDPIYLAGEHY